MTELPFELQRLPQSALDVLRYFGENGNAASDEEVLIEATGLSSRGLGKAIKRLVTRKFAEMDIHRRYQLTDKGLQLMEELLAYDAKHGDANADDDLYAAPTSALMEPVNRRLSVVVPEPFLTNQAAKVYVGMEDGLPTGETELLLRFSLLNAEPEEEEVMFSVAQGAAFTQFAMTPGEFTTVRLRVEVFQPDPYSGDIHSAGGLYVDVDVTTNLEEAGQLSAFGADITLMP